MIVFNALQRNKARIIETIAEECVGQEFFALFDFVNRNQIGISLYATN